MKKLIAIKNKIISSFKNVFNDTWHFLIKQFGIRDVFLFTGLILLSKGLSDIYTPAAYIASGLILIIVATRTYTK